MSADAGRSDWGETDDRAPRVIAWVMVGFFVGVVSTLIVLGVFG